MQANEQGFGIEPYVVYSPPMVASLGMIPRLVVAALMLVNLSPLHNKQSRKSMEDSVAGVFRPSSSLDARDNLDNTQYK